MSKRIYVTYCSGKKDDSLRGTGKRVTPDKLYISERIQRFIKKCKEKGVEWAIFSDKYGIVFPDDEIAWYDKHPSKVKPGEFKFLVNNFIERLSGYDEIWFYYNPGRFHEVYRRLIEEVKSRGLNVRLFSHLSEIR